MRAHSVGLIALLACTQACGQLVLLGDVCDRPQPPVGPYGVEPANTVDSAISWSGGYPEGAKEPATITLFDYYSPLGCNLTSALVIMEVSQPAGAETNQLGDAFGGAWAGLRVRVLQLLLTPSNATSAAAQLWRQDKNNSHLWATAPDPFRLLTNGSPDESLWLIDPRSMRVVTRLPRDEQGQKPTNWLAIRDQAAALAKQNQ